MKRTEGKSGITSPNLKKALNDLTLMHPFWATLVLHYDFKEVKGDPDYTFSIDGKTIRYNPDFCNRISVDVCMFALAHEAAHPMLEHLTRIFQPRPGDGKIYGYVKGKPIYWNPKLWNVAGDKIINAMLKASGFTLWNKCILDATVDPNTMTTEQVYNRMEQQQNQPPPPPRPRIGGGTPGCGQEPKQGNDPGDGDDGDSDQHADGTPSPASTNTLHDQPRNPGDPETDPICGDDIEAPAEGYSQQEMREMVVRAAAIAKAQGKLPGAIEGIIKAATEPQYPVFMLLERFVDMAIHSDDSSWKRPHRDFFSRGIILPSDYSETVSHVVVVYDTSGSVPDEDLSRFHRVAGDILFRLKPSRLTLLQCDADVHKVTEVRSRNDWNTEIQITGRGGTSFKPPFTYLKDKQITPTCLVYLTDLCGDFPEFAPRYPVLWVSTEKDTKAPFGTTINLNQ